MEQWAFREINAISIWRTIDKQDFVEPGERPDTRASDTDNARRLSHPLCRSFKSWCSRCSKHCDDASGQLGVSSLFPCFRARPNYNVPPYCSPVKTMHQSELAQE